MSRKAIAILLSFIISATPAAAQSEDAARSGPLGDPNRLFVEAVMLYRQASSEPPELQAETHLKVRTILEQLVANFPYTSQARSIETGGTVAGIDLDQLALAEPYGWNDGKRRYAETILAAYDQDEARLRQVAAAAPFALLACAAYSDNGLTCEDEHFGNPTVDLGELGWRAEGITRDLTAIGRPVAFLYIQDGEPPVLSFRGTDEGIEDNVTNVIGTMDFGFVTTAQLDFARDEALLAAEANPDLILVGHSLGGRLAQIGSLATGRPAIVFNSAPIGAWETIRYPQSLTGQNDLVQRFRTPDDPVSILIDETVGVSMPAKHIDVSNIAQTGKTQATNLLGAGAQAFFDEMPGLGFVHAMPVLAGGIAEVARVVNKGWLDALLREQAQAKARPPGPLPALVGPLPDFATANSTSPIVGEVISAPTTEPGGKSWILADGPDIDWPAGIAEGELTFAADGRFSIGQQTVFPAAPDPEAARLHLYTAPDGSMSLAIQFDADQGGVRGAVVDIRNEKVVADLIAEDAVWLRAPAEKVRLLKGPVAWSPDGAQLALPISTAQGEADLLVVDLANGAVQILAPDGMAEGQWAWPDMASLRTTADGELVLSFDIVACADTDCMEPKVVNSVSGKYRLAASTTSAASQKETTPRTSATAPSHWGPDLVAAADIGYDPCGQARETPDCLRKAGLSDEAVRFARAVDEDYSGRRVGASFIELGSVDLATVQFIGADIHRYPVLLNGPVNLHYVEGTRDLRAHFRDKSSQAMLRQFPTASNSAGQAFEIRSHRFLSDGTQRFVLIETLTDQCRVCQILGSAVTFIEIGPSTNNRLVRRPIGLQLSDRGSSAKITAAAIRSRPETLQMSLNALGYEAGKMDGNPGPQTRTALMEFQAEHCLPPTGQPDITTAAVLIMADGFETPCADARLPEGISANSPLLTGIYVEDPNHCQRDDFDLDMPRGRIVGDRSIAFGIESGCTAKVRSTSMLNGATLFRGTCSEGAESSAVTWVFDVLSPDVFVEQSWDGRATAPKRFQRCASDSPFSQAWLVPAFAEPATPPESVSTFAPAVSENLGNTPMTFDPVDPDDIIAQQRFLATHFPTVLDVLDIGRDELINSGEKWISIRSAYMAIMVSNYAHNTLGVFEDPSAAAELYKTYARSGGLSAAKSLGIDMASDFAKGIAVDITASFLTDLAMIPFKDLNANIQVPLRAGIDATMVEAYKAVEAYKRPDKVIWLVLDRGYDMIEIYKASRGLAAQQDEGLLTTAMGIQTAATVFHLYGDQPQARLAVSNTLTATQSIMVDMVGKDDAAQVGNIFSLGFTALRSHYGGNDDKARSLRDEIIRMGNEGNWPSLSIPDTFTYIANLGQDAPKRAATMIVNFTDLASIDDFTVPADTSAENSGIGEMIRMQASPPGTPASPGHGSVVSLVDTDVAGDLGIVKLDVAPMVRGATESLQVVTRFYNETPDFVILTPDEAVSPNLFFPSARITGNDRDARGRAVPALTRESALELLREGISGGVFVKYPQFDSITWPEDRLKTIQDALVVAIFAPDPNVRQAQSDEFAALTTGRSGLDPILTEQLHFLSTLDFRLIGLWDGGFMKSSAETWRIVSFGVPHVQSEAGAELDKHGVMLGPVDIGEVISIFENGPTAEIEFLTRVDAETTSRVSRATGLGLESNAVLRSPRDGTLKDATVRMEQLDDRRLGVFRQYDDGWRLYDVR